MSEEQFKNIFAGDFSVLPPEDRNIVRIFLSSTFGGKLPIGINSRPSIRGKSSDQTYSNTLIAPRCYKYSVLSATRISGEVVTQYREGAVVLYDHTHAGTHQHFHI